MHSKIKARYGFTYVQYLHRLLVLSLILPLALQRARFDNVEICSCGIVGVGVVLGDVGGGGALNYV